MQVSSARSVTNSGARSAVVTRARAAASSIMFAHRSAGYSGSRGM